MFRATPSYLFLYLFSIGGTTDVAVHEILEENSLREIHRATGDSWGGNNVTENIINFFSDLVGEDIRDAFATNNRNEYLELLNDIERKKKSANPSGEDLNSLSFSIPSSFFTIKTQEEMETYLKTKYDSDVRILKTKIQFSMKVFCSFFGDIPKLVVSHIKAILDSVSTSIDKLLMVGGFSECIILQMMVREAFGETMEVIIPFDASLCVAKGAVLFGFQPSVVTERIARYTYGVAKTVRFVEEKFPAERNVKIGTKNFCDNVFDIHVKVGQKLRYGEYQANCLYYPMSVNDTCYSVAIYRSLKADPMFVDEEDCEYVGCFTAKRPFPKGTSTKDEHIRVQLSFGHSDIRCKITVKDNIVLEPSFHLPYFG